MNALNVLGGIAVAMVPFLAVIGLLRLADRIARRREHVLGRQIALTDAIHRELGAVAAPVVRRRLDGRWRITMAVPLDQPGVTAALVRIVEQMFLRDQSRFGIVLTPRDARSTAVDGRWRSRARHLDSPRPAVPAFR